MAVNVYTDDVEVVNGSSLDTPSTDNYSLYGNEEGKSVKIPKATLTNSIKKTLVGDGSCLSNDVQEITVENRLATIDIDGMFNNDMSVASDPIDSIEISGEKICRFSFFFTSLTDNINIQGKNIYINKITFTANKSYLAEITTNKINGTSTVFIIFHELEQL